MQKGLRTGLDPWGSWKLKAIGMCFGLAEVTLETAGNWDVLTLGALPRKSLTLQSVQSGDLMGVLVPVPPGAKLRKLDCHKPLRKGVMHGLLLCQVNRDSERRSERGKQAVYDWQRWTASSSRGRPSGGHHELQRQARLLALTQHQLLGEGV